MRLLTFIFIWLACVPFVGAQAIGTPDPDTIQYPGGKKPSEKLIHLGKVLFFDKRLSVNNQQSCASCHNPNLGLGDGVQQGFGTAGNRLGRNTPHLYNLAWATSFFWDGRAGSLEEQALMPIQNPDEMNMSLEELVHRLQAIPYYTETFARLFPDSGLTAVNVAKALAAFERTIISNNSPFDRYLRGDFAAMEPAAVRGMVLFKGKARCAVCHSGANFTDNKFHNIGVSSDDPGRQAVDGDPASKGAFKTPGLRNILLTAPYLHNGAIGTIEELIIHYNKGGDDVPNKSPLMQPLGLTDIEIFELIAFLGALTDPVRVERPQMPEADFSLFQSSTN